MKVVLPGKPASSHSTVSTGFWASRRIIAYITGNAFAILSDHQTLLQTVYDDDESPLRAIAFDEASGKIATATDRHVRIYKPFGLEDDALRWALQSLFEPFLDDDDDSSTSSASSTAPVSLSWGASEELLVARASLKLYQTSSTPSCSWSKRLAAPAECASLSYDSGYIACCGYSDRLVKVWRRLSFGSDDVCFDFVYLRHPAPVTRIQWRQPYDVDQTIENVLYTFCADQSVRIWSGSESHHSGQHLQLWGTIDLQESLRGRHPQRPDEPLTRWAFILHGRDISAAAETAVQESATGQADDDMGLQHVVAVANRNPELCIVLDTAGGMSAWALENVGSRTAHKTGRIFNAAHIYSKDFDFARSLSLSADAHVEVHSYCNKTGGHLHLLLHDFRGTIHVYEANMADMLHQASTAPRLRLKGSWSGHSASVQKIVRNYSGRAIVSRTRDGESSVWTHKLGARSTSLSQLELTPTGEQGHIHRICVLRKGRFVVFLHHDSITLWDCRPPGPPSLLGRSAYSVGGKPLCLLILPRQRPGDSSVAHVATITSEKQGVVWAMSLPPYSADGCRAPPVNGHGRARPAVAEFCRFSLQGTEDLAYVLPVDPAGSSPVISGFLDVFARDVAVSYTREGRVDFLTARVDAEQDRVEWLTTCSMETGLVEPSLVSGSTLKRAALVNSSRSAVTIWDIRGARLEYTQDFESQNAINDLDWTSTPDSQSVLAVGFPHRVLLLSQLRFDYLNKGPAWAPVREISIRDMTPHPIGDSTWLGDGHLVIGAGNQLFVHDRQFDPASSLITSLRLPHRKDGCLDLFDVVRRLNGPLPVFHPQFLSQCMLAGKTTLVHRILTSLDTTLKYWVEGETIDDYLGLDMEVFYGAQSPTHDYKSDPNSSTFFAPGSMHDAGGEEFNEQVANSINSRLTKVALPQLSGHEQIQLVDIVECAGLVETQRRSMDDNGARYMLFYRQHALRKGRTNEIHMSWREINWAHHSTSQDILVDFVSRQNHGSLRWESARESGMFMWLSDAAAVRRQFEVVARNEYTGSEAKNPVDCSLFYLALRKKTVLQGLWRMAGWNREQAATQRLLANNFDDPRWRTAALKNAYALMSKRRFEYAAAFFLLADHLQDAVNVCLGQLKDVQLAVAVARVYEGDDGPVMRRLLEEEVLAIAAQEGNRWLASWAFWMLRRKDMAVRALITPVYALLETPYSPDIKSKLFLTDDPALIVLYAQLRQTTLQTLRGASKVTPKVEWEFVLHNARLYDRMGCDLLGLDLVRNWEFLGSSRATPGLGGDIDPLKLLRRRSSLVVADMPVAPLSPTERRAAARGGAHQPPPSVFEEPDSNSLLDSFGF